LTPISQDANTELSVIDFDQIKRWSPQLKEALSALMTDLTLSSIRRANPKYVEDARDVLFELAGRDDVIDTTLQWLRTSTIAGYHGTRLTDDEVRSVWQKGLLPLAASARRARLVRALSQHPNWNTVAQRLDAVLKEHGPDNRAGHREGQAHLTLSRAGLVNGFNHYLTHGSEFDQHAAQALLGDEGSKLLARDGKRRVIQFAVPGQAALNAAHPYFSIQDVRARGDVPTLRVSSLRRGAIRWRILISIRAHLKLTVAWYFGPPFLLHGSQTLRRLLTSLSSSIGGKRTLIKARSRASATASFRPCPPDNFAEDPPWIGPQGLNDPH
jgi:hypothetical protein